MLLSDRGNTVVLTFHGDNVSPLIRAVDSGSSIRVIGLVSGKLIGFRVKPPVTVGPREGTY